MSATKLFDAGFTDILPVVPPTGKLSTRSQIQPDQRGKTPARKNRSGTWGGFDWLKYEATRVDAQRMEDWGANVGMKAARFPGVDVDVNDAMLAQRITAAVLKNFGPAPIRLSRAPRTLLVYRTDQPFGKLVLKLEKEGAKHAIEILGAGQQYLVHGTHPSGALYRWAKTPLWDVSPEDLCIISQEGAKAFLSDVAEWLRGEGYVCEMSGGGETSVAPPQDHLFAPSLEALTELVGKIPNAAEGGWDHMVKFGCAVKAAGAEWPGEALDAFLDWCARWEGDGDPDNDERDRANWDSFKPPFRLGWAWLQEQADSFGHCSAADEFEADMTAVEYVKVMDGSTDPESTLTTTATIGNDDGKDSWAEGRGVRISRLEDLNKNYAIVQVGADVVVLQLQESGETTFMKWGAFELLLANQQVPDKDQPFKNEALTKAWKVWPGRRHYTRVVFKPGMIAPPGEYNLWRGWAIEPSDTGSCDLFMRHLLTVVCSGERAHTKWLLDWMAHIFQHPMTKPGTVVGFQGRQGAGKSIVGAVLKRLLGRHHLEAEKSDQVVGRFNKHLEDCLLLQAEEAFWGGSKAAAGTLKHLVTGSHLMIERKGIDSVQMDNYTRLLITSNEDQLWPTSIDDRRLAVFRVKSDRVEDHGYFGAMLAEMESGGYAKLLHVLLNRTIDLDALRRPPITEALLAHANEALSAEEAWLLRILEHGEIQGRLYSDGSVQVGAAVLYDHYQSTLPKHRGYAKNEPAFGHFVKEQLQAKKTSSRVRVDTCLRSGVRSTLLLLPPLDAVRAQYSARGRGARSEWSGGAWTIVDEWGEVDKETASAA